MCVRQTRRSGKSGRTERNHDALSPYRVRSGLLRRVGVVGGAEATSMIPLLMCFAPPDCEWRLNAMFLIIADRHPFLQSVIALTVGLALSFYCFWDLHFGTKDRSWVLYLIGLVISFLLIIYGLDAVF
jgi:hypothetical protein